MKTSSKKRTMRWALLAALVVPGTGCGDDASPDSADGASTNGGSNADGGGDGSAGMSTNGGNEGGGMGSGGGAKDEPLFAVPTEIFGADFSMSTSFVPFVPSLDVDRISLDQAREVPGRASVAAIGGWMFIASSTKPIITRFQVKPDGTLVEDLKLSFANFGVPEYFSIDPWGNVPINATKAYIFNRSDGGHVVWNPTVMEIEGEIEGPDVILDGYNLESIAVVRGKRMYRILAFLNYDSWEFLSDVQYLAVYDLETDKLIDLIEETRCPLLYSRPFIDENNDIYFSGWVWTAAETLVHGAPKNCALRIRDGEDTFDPNWQLTYADEVTDGREAGILRYLGDGKALLDVFHDERTTIDDDTDSQELSNSPNWRLWRIDLETKTGAPLEGLTFKAAGYQDVQIDGRTFLMVPNGDYSETTAYEIVGGEAVEGFKIQGSSYHMVQVR